MADVPSARTLKGVGGTFPPKQWIELGAYLEKTKSPDKALIYDAPPAQVNLTPENWAKIQNIVRSLPLKQYEYKPGQPWRFDQTATIGDCNVAALGRMKALAVNAGLPAGAFRPAYVSEMHDIPHLVMTIDTDHGTFVVDGVPQALIQPWDRAPFQWHSRLVQGLKWERFNP